MKLNKISNAKKLAVGAGLAVASSMSSAAIDVAPVTSALGDAGTAIAVVGAAVLVVIVGTKVFKWVARAL